MTDLAAEIQRILKEQHVPWGATLYARDLKRRIEQLLKDNEDD